MPLQFVEKAAMGNVPEPEKLDVLHVTGWSPGLALWHLKMCEEGRRLLLVYVLQYFHLAGCSTL
jgi:hypothetical protein